MVKVPDQAFIARGMGVPPPEAPAPPPPPTNANVLAVILAAGGTVVILFDFPVNIDQGAPPLSWTVGGNNFTPGGTGYFASASMLMANPPSVGDTVVIGGGDPAARTPEGGYVNGTTMGLSAG